MFYISNLAAGLEHGLDNPDFLMQAVRPFEGHAGIEFFLHVHDPAYSRKLYDIPEWIGGLPRTVHGPFIGVEAASKKGTPEHFHMLDAYMQAFDTAQMLGCDEMVFHTHQRRIEPDEVDSARDCVRESLRELIDRGKPYGVTILIENLDFQKSGASLFDESHFAELIETFPDAECLIDIGHLNVAGWNLERTLTRLSDRIKGYHLHNNDGLHDSHRPIGEGTLFYPYFYELYKKLTPSAYLTLEYGDGPDITPEKLVRDLESVMNGVA